MTKTIHHPKLAQQTTVIFVANGFEEEYVTKVLSHEKTQGKRIKFLGVSAGEKEGHRGIRLLTDGTISWLDNSRLEAGDSLVFPGNEQCASAILSDPRIWKLVSNADQQNIRILCSSVALSIMQKMGLKKAVMDICNVSV